MQWTERKSWLGTYREKRGRWHGIPYVVSAPSAGPINRQGWILVIVALLLFATVVVLEELLV